MSEQVVVCPKCKSKIPLSSALSEQVSDLMKKKEESIQAKLAKQFEVEADKIRKAAVDEAKRKQAVEMRDIAARFKESEELLEGYRTKELDMRKQMRLIEQQKKELDLEVTRRMEDEVKKAQEVVAKQFAEDYARQIADKDRKINDMHQKLIELERKAAQGSQQAQGELLEEELEKALTTRFPQDEFTPIAKGRAGADILQSVRNSALQVVGKILWEGKRTKTFEEKFTTKLKDDMRAAGADIGIIVTETFPKDANGKLIWRDGVWITDLATAQDFAVALRAGLLELFFAKQSAAGKNEKMEVLYQYLMGSHFRQKIEAIVTGFRTLRTDIESEKAAMNRIWNKREKEIQRIVDSTTGMYGDLQGLIAMPTIRSLELGEPALID